MATIPNPSIMVFKKDQGANFKEVRHYDLIEGNPTFSSKINIGINRGFSKAKYIYSLKIKRANKWSKQITGLFKTMDPYIYYGDTMDKKNMVWFKFSACGNLVTIYYFQTFYTTHVNDFLQFLKERY